MSELDYDFLNEFYFKIIMYMSKLDYELLHYEVTMNCYEFFLLICMSTFIYLF